MSAQPVNWRGEWLSLHDLAALLGKSYDSVLKLRAVGIIPTAGMRLFDIVSSPRFKRTWVRIDEEVYKSLLNPPA